jgi:hypothetical protein
VEAVAMLENLFTTEDAESAEKRRTAKQLSDKCWKLKCSSSSFLLGGLCDLCGEIFDASNAGKPVL